jgi:ABC-type nitrate/sulfonate/bicarbonate transport system substrate-binding protein
MTATTKERVALSVNSFQGIQNLPLAVARSQGYLAAAGLDVTLTLTTSSAAQLAGLAAGRYDLIHTAPDNVINYDTDPQAFGVEPGAAPPAVMLMGGSNGPLTLYARPDTSDFVGLRGCEIGVDNPTSGFALVARGLLASAGLELQRDYRFVSAGSTARRAEQLRDGLFAATILYPPFDRVAEAARCHALASSTSAYPAYASQALAVLPTFVRTMSDAVTAYIAALLRALRWIHDPTNRPAVTALIAADADLGALTLDPAATLAAFTDPTTGYGVLAPLGDAGLAQVIALRARFGAPALPLGLPADYRDLRYYERALALLSRLPN